MEVGFKPVLSRSLLSNLYNNSVCLFLFLFLYKLRIWPDFWFSIGTCRDCECTTYWFVIATFICLTWLPIHTGKQTKCIAFIWNVHRGRIIMLSAIMTPFCNSSVHSVKFLHCHTLVYISEECWGLSTLQSKSTVWTLLSWQNTWK